MAQANEKAKAAKSKPQAISLAGLLNHEPPARSFPQLEELFKHFSTVASQEMRKLISGESVHVSYEGVTARHFNEHYAMAAQLTVEDSDDALLLVMDARVIFMLVKFMLGSQMLADASEASDLKSKKASGKKDGKVPEVGENTAMKASPSFTLTPIETHLATKVFKACTLSLSESSKAMGNKGFIFHHLTFGKGDSLFPYPMVCGIGEFLLGVEGNEAPFFIVCPYTTHQFLFGPMVKGHPASFVKDTVWRDHVEDTALGAHAECCAILGETFFPLREVLAWKTGKTFSLNVTPDAPIPLRCRGKTFFWGKIGQKNNLISLALERVVRDEREGLANEHAAD